MQPTPKVLEVIETAIQIERDGQAFYEAAARQTKDPRDKRMFQSLAKEEAAHLQLFEDTREALLQRGRWLSPQEVSAISPDATDRPAIFPSAGEIGRVETSAQVLSLLQRGLEAETASIDFYAAQIEATDDRNAQSMYAYLIEQEKAHHAILQAQYEYLSRAVG